MNALIVEERYLLSSRKHHRQFKKRKFYFNVTFSLQPPSQFLKFPNMVAIPDFKRQLGARLLEAWLVLTLVKRYQNLNLSLIVNTG